MKQPLTVSVFTENKIGLLHRITVIFTRRKLNIESLTVSESEIKGVHRFTIVVEATMEQAVKMVKQIEKQVEVLKAFVHDTESLVHQEIALYKIPVTALQHNKVEVLVRDSNIRVLAIEPEYLVIEKTGHPEETQQLFDTLQPYGVLEFVRSGSIAITKPMKALSAYLQELEEAQLAWH